MKKAITLFMVLSFLSCSIEYDGETRLVFETNIVDSQGNPLSGQNINIDVYATNAIDLISDGITDANGKLQLIFPAPKGAATRIRVTVGNENGVYMGRIYDNIQKINFEDFKLRLPNLALYKAEELVPLNFTLNQVTGLQVTALRIEGQYHNELVDVNPDASIYGQIVQQYQVLKNQNITLHYSLTDFSVTPNVVTEHTAVIPVATDPVDYTITY